MFDINFKFSWYAIHCWSHNKLGVVEHIWQIEQNYREEFIWNRFAPNTSIIEIWTEPSKIKYNFVNGFLVKWNHIFFSSDWDGKMKKKKKTEHIYRL